MQAHQKLGRSILILIVKVFLIKTIMQKVGPRLIKIFIIFCFKILYIYIFTYRKIFIFYWWISKILFSAKKSTTFEIKFNNLSTTKKRGKSTRKFKSAVGIKLKFPLIKL